MGNYTPGRPEYSTVNIQADLQWLAASVLQPQRCQHTVGPAARYNLNRRPDMQDVLEECSPQSHCHPIGVRSYILLRRRRLSSRNAADTLADTMAYRYCCRLK